jgi:endonuclease/exonuclease/phosphatase family metal-dependent hydrolase
MELSVVSWNIWYNQPVEAVAEVLAELDADVVCLQELTRGLPEMVADGPAYLAEQLGYRYIAPPIARTDKAGWTQANGVFTKLSGQDGRWCYVQQPSGTGGYADEYRSYVELACAVGTEIVHVGTAHLSYTDGFYPTAAKAAETDALVAELGHHTERYVFCGDLNALPGSYTQKAVAKTLVHCGPDMAVPTWTTKPFAYNGFSADELAWRLDYVFATPDLVVRSAEVVDADVSDHLPVLVRFAINPH